MAKRKVFTEILITCLVIFCLLLSSLILILTTVAIFNWTNTISLIISFVVCILYKIRIYLLFREYRMLNDKPVDCLEMNDNHQLNQQLNKQINKQMIHQNSLNRASLQSNQLKDDEIDDDVFS